MSDKINTDELKDVAGGVDEPVVTGKRNPGGACRKYVCEICGATPSEITFDSAGNCTGCQAWHNGNCRVGWKEYPAGFLGHCNNCVHRVSSTECDAN